MAANLFASLPRDDHLLNLARALFILVLASHLALCLATARSSWGRLLWLFNMNPLRRRLALPATSAGTSAPVSAAAATPASRTGTGRAVSGRKAPRAWPKLARNALAGLLLWAITAASAYFSGVGGLRRSEKQGEEARFLRGSEVLGLMGAAVGFVWCVSLSPPPVSRARLFKTPAERSSWAHPNLLLPSPCTGTPKSGQSGAGLDHHLLPAAAARHLAAVCDGAGPQRLGMAHGAPGHACSSSPCRRLLLCCRRGKGSATRRRLCPSGAESITCVSAAAAAAAAARARRRKLGQRCACACATARLEAARHRSTGAQR
jgi:hypothetical protein